MNRTGKRTNRICLAGLIVVITVSAITLSSCLGNSLLDAAFMGDKKKAERLIAIGTDVNTRNRYGFSPLHHAVARRDVEMVELLLAHGANVNAKGQFDITPLHYASQEKIAELLIANGANIEAVTDRGETPLHWMVASGIGEKTR